MRADVDQVAGLMALFRDLEEVMRAEVALLDMMRLRDFEVLQNEKADLAAALERRLRQFRTDPAGAGALDPTVRTSLESAMRAFQAQAAAHARRLAAARAVVEGVLRELGRGLTEERVGRTYGATAAGRERGAQVVPLALDRQL